MTWLHGSLPPRDNRSRKGGALLGIVLPVQRTGDMKVVDGSKVVPADMSGQEADEDIVF